MFSDRFADGPREDILVIEDRTMVTLDAAGNLRPGFRFIDGHTVRAHPIIIDVLLNQEEAEPLWTMDELLRDLSIEDSGATG